MNKFFVFDGNEAFLTEQITPMFKHIGTVKIKIFKAQYNILICIHTKELSNSFIIPYDKYPNLSISYLKSHLQKCIRRKKSMLTLYTINSLLAKNAHLDLLRRLFVISGEDVIINPDTNILTWCITAISKGFVLTDALVQKIKNIGVNLSQYDFQDKKYSNVNVTESNVIESLNNNVSFILQIGRTYLGLKGDLLMFHKLSYIWYKRFELNISFEAKLYNLWNSKSDTLLSNQLNPQNLILTSIDFHVSNIDQRIQYLFDANINDIKKAIWTYASSINYRIFTNLNDINIYNDLLIKDLWNDISILFEIEAQKIKTNLISHN